MTESDGVATLASVAAALRGYRLGIGGVHGPGHWLRVLANGRGLAAGTPGADPLVVELFALFHDCRRRDDGRDPGHGERAAAYVKRLAAEGPLLDLDAGRLDGIVRPDLVMWPEIPTRLAGEPGRRGHLLCGAIAAAGSSRAAPQRSDASSAAAR
jgi:hypothetical protein